MMDSLKVPGEKTQIVPNGVDTGLFKKYPSKELRKELGLSGNFVLGYVGVLREWVDFEPVFKALKSLNKKKVKVLIVGEEGRFTEKKELAKKCGIEDRVVFSGTIPYSEVPKYISCMDTCLIPFRVNKISENAVPLKLFEYMACERPVISTRLRGVEDTIGDRILYANSTDEYIELVSELMNDKSLPKGLGKKGRGFVVENYDWRTNVRDLERVLIKFGN
jgi:glycosyltransferase involved in cell wall biosynthesis